jgi:dimethylamine corrinoid protein
MSKENEIISELKNSVVTFNVALAVKMANEAVTNKVDAKKAIMEGLSAGMSVVGEKYERKEYYLPQVMTASLAMNKALDILKPHIRMDTKAVASKKVVVCTVEGDVHSIGKTILATLLGVAGYSVNDLGADVRIAKIIDTGVKEKADLIAMSTLMTSTMIGMKEAVEMLNERGIRSNYKVAVGGAPVNQEFCNQIGADVTATNAETAVKTINKMFGGA